MFIFNEHEKRAPFFSLLYFSGRPRNCHNHTTMKIICKENLKFLDNRRFFRPFIVQYAQIPQKFCKCAPAPKKSILINFLFYCSFLKFLLDNEIIKCIMFMFHLEDLCNGSTPDSDSVCGGSNPSSSAKKYGYPFGYPYFFALEGFEPI